jgi:hypothetical protein
VIWVHRPGGSPPDPRRCRRQTSCSPWTSGTRSHPLPRRRRPPLEAVAGAEDDEGGEQGGPGELDRDHGHVLGVEGRRWMRSRVC